MVWTRRLMRTAFILLVTMTRLANESNANIRADWELIYDIESPFFIIESDGDNLYAAGDNGIHVSRTGGNTWHYRDLGRDGEHVQVLTIGAGGGSVYLGTTHHGIFRSDDRGNTWQPKNNGMPRHPGTSEYISIHQILVTYSGAVIAVGYLRGTWISHDRGESWTAVTTLWKVPDVPLGEAVWSMTEFDGYLWAVYAGSPLIRSRDAGGIWVIVHTNIDNFDPVEDWAALDNTLYVAGGKSFGRWSEAEQRWEHLNRGLPAHSRYHSGINDLAVNRGRIFASLYLFHRGVWLFDQSSETWAPVGPKEAEGLGIYSITSRGSYLYAASTLGIHRGSVADVQSYGKILTTWGALKQSSD